MSEIACYNRPRPNFHAAAIRGFCEYGIAVNILDPGWNLSRPNDDYDDEVHKRMRLPDEIAKVAVYMVLQTHETMTGRLVFAAGYDEEPGIQSLSAYDRLHA